MKETEILVKAPLQLKSNSEVSPFVKWAGGKRWLASGIAHEFARLPNVKRYIEPFLGGGAAFFSIQPSNCVLSDLNSELINTYQVIQENPKEVTGRLKKLHNKHSESFYYQMRASRPTSRLGRAMRFLYLNRTCWNGLYRVNLKGEFNVPIGSKVKVYDPEEDFFQISTALGNAKIICGDFEKTLSIAGKGDFVYVDPPYTVKHNLNGFIKYNDKIFQWEDQVRLSNAIIKAHSRGAYVLLSNADHESVRELYSEIFHVRSVYRKSILAADPSKRGPTSEILVSNYEHR